MQTGSRRAAAKRVADGCLGLGLTFANVSGPSATERGRTTLLGLASQEQARGRRLGQLNAELEQLHSAAEKLGLRLHTAQQEHAATKLRVDALSAEVAEVEERLAKLEGELAGDEELQQAQHAVGLLQRKQLDELRKLPSPPETTRRTCELVYCILSVRPDWSSSAYRTPDWTVLKKLLSRADFVPSMLKFDPSLGMCDAQGFAAWVQERFLQGPKALTIEKAKFSSGVCNALFRWAVSQLVFARVLTERAPLREQLSACRDKVRGLRAELQTCQEVEGAQFGELNLVIIESDRLHKKLSEMEDDRLRLQGELDELVAETLRVLQGPSLAPEVTLASVEVEVTERISFTRNGHLISDVCTAPIRGVLQSLKDHPTLKLQIEGHAHSSENNPTQLAQARADAVRAQLIEQGVSAARLRACGVTEGAESRGACCEFRTIQELRVSASVSFSACTSDLSPECFQLLDEVAAVIMARTQMHMRVEGHTDSAYAGFIEGGNLGLSQARAEAVRTYLEAAGVPSGQLLAVGWGEDLPVASNETREGKASNRRVEFHVMARESQRGLSALLKDKDARLRLSKDANAIQQLRSIATGQSGIVDKAVRRAAASVVVACGATWSQERMLWIATTKEQSGKCHLRRLGPELVRLVMQWVVMNV